MPYSQEKRTAINAVTRAAALCHAVQREMGELDAIEKGDRSPVTVADYGSQALICQQLADSFPGDGIVAEEDSTALREPDAAAQLNQVVEYVRHFCADATPQRVCAWIDRGRGRVGPRFWTLDPIDGTKGFLRRQQYAVALALIEGGQVQVAALGCPALPLELGEAVSPVGTLFVAVRGEGAFMCALGSGDPVPIRVSQGGNPSQLRLVESVEEAHGHALLQEAIAQAVGIHQPALRLDSQAKYGILARGEAALYLRLPSPGRPAYREKIWDHAAGALIVEEAGGRVTDMHGQALDLAAGESMAANRGVIASNGTLHGAVLRALAERMGALDRA
jgi:3'(2'), 5'-bisphosphate nucleotidase